MSFKIIWAICCIVATRTSQCWLLSRLDIFLIFGILFTSQHMTFVMGELFRFITTEFTFVNFWYFLDYFLRMNLYMTNQMIFSWCLVVTSLTLEELHRILRKEKCWSLFAVYRNDWHVHVIAICTTDCRVIDYLICSRYHKNNRYYCILIYFKSIL